MAESINNYNKQTKNNSDNGMDVIALNILTIDQKSPLLADSNSITLSPISTTQRLFSRNQKKLNLKFTSAVEETTSSIATNNCNSIVPHEQNKTIQKLNIGFENISCSARVGFLRRDTKLILQGLTGYFKAGEISAILGPSGAGKSSCLNILSGYKAYGYNGIVTVNNNVRDIKAFKPNVAFITQYTSLHSYLTVKEAMIFSSNLKVDAHVGKIEKKQRVKRILEAIGLYESRHTRTSELSGGQKKRLSIALELVNNPPVLIMDEPTTGLDSSASKQLISLLKRLALEGRTVICTIHQPSATTFEIFDHLYAIANGSCIYSGGTKNLVPFLAEIGLQCPEFYNPADYLMEIATDDYGLQNEKLIAKIENGRNDFYRETKGAKKKGLEVMQKVVTPAADSSNSFSPSLVDRGQATTSIKERFSRIDNSKSMLNEFNNDSFSTSGDNGCCHSIERPKLCKRENIYATPFYRQLDVLLQRTFLILWRDKSLAMMRFIIHLITALLIGFLYYGIGNEAENALDNFRYCFYSIMFIMYSAFSAIVVKFPLEFPIVSREHFNRWYSLRAYYIAMTLADIPIQFVCVSVYIVITYLLTNQPRDIFRMMLFCVIIFLTALVGQSIGLAVGASLNLKLAVTLGPFFISVFLFFSGFFLQEQHAPEKLKWAFKTSFIKYSLDGSIMAIFGFNRPRLECNAMYCHYSRPKIFLKDLDMLNANYQTAIIFLASLFLVLRIISFYIMSFRLRLFR